MTRRNPVRIYKDATRAVCPWIVAEKKGAEWRPVAGVMSQPDALLVAGDVARRRRIEAVRALVNDTQIIAVYGQ